MRRARTALWLPLPYRARRALLFNRKSFLPIFVPASFCASVGAASKAARHVLSPSNVSIAATVLVPGTALALPLYFLFSAMGLADTYAAVLIPFMVVPLIPGIVKSVMMQSNFCLPLRINSSAVLPSFAVVTW